MPGTTEHPKLTSQGPSDDRAGQSDVGSATEQWVLDKVTALLRAPSQDLREILLKEMLIRVIRLADSPLQVLDIKILSRTIKELYHAFQVFHPYRDRRKVTIFGSARTASDDPNYQLAVRFGRLLADRGYMVITGAGDGIMKAGHEGAGKALSFGVNIKLPLEQAPNSIIRDDPKLMNFKYFYARKLMFLKESHAVAVFPGGFGTQDEGFEVLTLVQTGKANPQPIICLEAPGTEYWSPWRAFVTTQLLDRGLIDLEDMNLLTICRSEREAVDEIETFYHRYHSIRYVNERCVVRMTRPLSNDQLKGLNRAFGDVLIRGSIEQCAALPEEGDEPALNELPRLVFHYHRRSAGRLRQFIDHLNALPDGPT